MERLNPERQVQVSLGAGSDSRAERPIKSARDLYDHLVRRGVSEETTEPLTICFQFFLPKFSSCTLQFLQEIFHGERPHYTRAEVKVHEIERLDSI